MTRQRLARSMFGKTIAFHRVFFDITGSINAALLLSQAVYWTEVKEEMGGKFFYKSNSEWFMETGLSRTEQATARNILNKFTWWHEEKRMANGSPTVHYWVDLKALTADATATLYPDATIAQNTQSPDDHCLPASNALLASEQSITESTAENTYTPSSDDDDVLRPDGPITTDGELSKEEAQPPLLADTPKPTARGRAAKPKKSAAVLTPEWRDTLMPILFGHSNPALMAAQHWGSLKALAAKLDAAGVEPPLVNGWFLEDWKKDWRGSTGQAPTPAQLLMGVGGWTAQNRLQPPGLPDESSVIVVEEENDW